MIEYFVNLVTQSEPFHVCKWKGTYIYFSCIDSFLGRTFTEASGGREAAGKGQETDA